MIERLRRGAQSGLSYILIGVLIVFFAVFFGVPADGCMAGDGQRTLIASVDGEDLHTEDVNVIQNRIFADERSGAADRDYEYFIQQAEALRIVMAIHLLADRAEDVGLRVGDEEFNRFMTDPIRNVEFMTTYGRTGQLDGDFYERYVQHGLRVPISSYEEFKRRELLARKYLAMLDMQAHTSPGEIEELHELRNTRVDLEYVQFDDETLIDVVGLEDDDIEEFLASDEGRQRVQDYYDEHSEDYQEPEQYRVRRIFVRTDDDPDTEPEDFVEARQRVEDGEDFATVARELSEGHYNEDGGLMGDWSTLEDIQHEIAEAIEGGDVGDVEEVETAHAHMLVKIDDKQQERHDALEDVEDEIAEQLLRRDIVQERGGELAEQLHARLTGDVSIEDALDELEEEAREDDREADAEIWAGLQAETTGFFTLEDEQMPAGLQQQQQQFDFGGMGSPWYDIPGLGEDRDLAAAAFELTEDEPLLDEVVEINDSRLVARLQEREEPGEMTTEDRMELEAEVRMEKSQELLGDWRSFFMQPSPDMAHFIDAVVQEAFEDGSIRLYDRNSQAAAYLQAQIEEDGQVAAEDVIDLPQTQRQQPPGVGEDDEEDDEPGRGDAPGPGEGGTFQ